MNSGKKIPMNIIPEGQFIDTRIQRYVQNMKTRNRIKYKLYTHAKTEDKKGQSSTKKSCTCNINLPRRPGMTSGVSVRVSMFCSACSTYYILCE